jgi:hypothetical protein
MKGKKASRKTRESEKEGRPTPMERENAPKPGDSGPLEQYTPIF